jgi:hypothetical protein
MLGNMNVKISGMFGMLYRTPCDNVGNQNIRVTTAALENSNSKLFSVQFFGNWDISVGIANPYGLNASGIECW